jgi:group I intron endonuclease
MKGIYLIQNKVNGKRYIGRSNNIDRRFAEHKSECNIKKNNPLANDFKIYTVNSFDFSIIEIVQSESVLDEREIYWIAKLNPEYNKCIGGKGAKGYSHSDETKDILRALGKLQWESKSNKDKQRQIVNNLKGRSVGYNHTEETKEKLRNANLGKVQTAETKKKRSEKLKISAIGNSNGSKKVVCISNEEVYKEYDSILIAANELQIHPSNITKVLKRKQNTAGGYKWKYKNQL